MKKLSIATLIGVPLLSLSSMAFATEPVAAEPVLLSAAEMDGVTAGQAFSYNNLAGVLQFNVSPVTVVQISVLNGAGGGNNTAAILSGNWASLYQH